MDNASLCIQRALQANALREPVLRSAVQSLGLPLGSHGLDAGCGIGLQTLLLARAVGPSGHVTGLDILPYLPAFGQEKVQQAGYSDRITFCAGDVSHLPFEEDSFDWVWSSDCIGYPVGELLPFLEELRRVVRPGGSIVILGWSGQQLLPGYPLLEARLNATCSGYIPYFEGGRADQNFLRALGRFRKAGLIRPQGHTFVSDVSAPLTGGQRAALLSLFGMIWGQPQPGVSPEDWREYQRLCESVSSELILDLPDYYAFFTYSLFRGEVPLA